jgi:hypothetical protein
MGSGNLMADPIRPDADIVDNEGVITPRWNSWFTWIDSTVSNARASGITAQRPIKSVYVGQFYFDTTLNYPVYISSVNPIIWRNGAGVVV